MKRERIDIIRDILMTLAGNAVYALAVSMFLVPNNLITGGTTGMALFFNRWLGVPVSGFVLAFNVAMFVLGVWVLGKKFAMTTLISTFFYPVFLAFFTEISVLATPLNDKLLAALASGGMIGLAIGMVIRAGGSTGGMDIPPLVLHKKWGIPVSGSLYVFDVLILIMQMFSANREDILYGIFLVLVYTVVLNKILLTGSARTQVKIVSEKAEEINATITGQLDRGSTLLHGETGYLHNSCRVVLTVIANRELPHLNQLVQSIDPKAFMIINRVNEVKGRGFTSQKEYR